MKIVRRYVLALLVIASAFWATWVLWYKVRSDAIKSRSLPNMRALAAAVEQFRQTNGRLPSSSEYEALGPVLGYQPFKSDSPEMMTSFDSPSQRAGDVMDARNRRLVYEQANNGYQIRSFGMDGIRSDDDFIYQP